MTTLELAHISMHDDGKSLQLGVDVSNTSARRLYACASVAALRYETATRLLAVELVPAKRGTAPGNYVLPKIVTIEAQQRVQITVTVPRIIARLGSTVAGASAPIERLPAHEAAQVEISLAWSDTRLEPTRTDPEAWTQGIVRGRSTLS